LAGAVQRGMNINTIFLYERAPTPWQFAVGVLVDDLEIVYQSTFPVDVDGWFMSDWSNVDIGPVVLSNSTDFAQPGDIHSLKVVTAENGQRVRRELGVSLASGESAHLSLWIYPTDDLTGLRVQIGDIDGGDFESTSWSSSGDAWLEVTLDYTATIDTGPIAIVIDNLTGGPTTYYVDDVIVRSASIFDEASADVDLSAIIEREKPIGMLFTTQFRTSTDWNLFMIGATRYARDAEGFMTITPSPYQTLADIKAHFTTLNDLKNNTPH
jgi:hypothetical protein